MNEVNTYEEMVSNMRATEREKFINDALAAGFTAPQAEFLFSMRKDTQIASMGFPMLF